MASLSPLTSSGPQEQEKELGNTHITGTCGIRRRGPLRSLSEGEGESCPSGFLRQEARVGMKGGYPREKPSSLEGVLVSICCVTNSPPEPNSLKFDHLFHS